jgi:hypothetical protein
MKKKDTPNAIVHMKDFDGIVKVLHRLEVDEGEKMLGVRLAADGNMNDEVAHRIKISKEWAEQVRTGHLPRHLVWHSLNYILLKKHGYVLETSTFSKAQCKAIMSPAIHVALSKSGTVRSLPGPLRHGPTLYGGYEIKDLYISQGVAHIRVLLDFCYQENHSTGQLLHSSAENLMVELGFPEAIFELNYKKYNKLATRAWMKCTWQFCDKFKITMHTTIPKLEPQCSDDEFLMPVFAAKCNASLLPQLNIFWKYLQVITLAEIVTADGK